MGAFPQPPDEERTLALLGRIEDGDREAWNDLYRRYHDRLLFTVRMRLGRGLRRHLESEDVFQSVALEAFRALPRFEYRGPGSLHRFLQALVVSKIRDRADTFGAAKRAGGVPLTDAMLDSLAGEGEPTYHDGARYERLERALAVLPDDLREVLLLRKVDGLSSKEAAEVLGKSDDATRKAYSRALARLTLVMGAEDEGRA